MRFIILLFLFPLLSFSQIDYAFNLKNINSINEDVVNIRINNPTNQAIYILKTESEANVTSRQYTNAIPPNSGTTVRFKLNPEKKGKLQEQVKIVLSDRADPITVQFNAKVLSIPKNNLQECPKFGGKYQFNSSTGVYERTDVGDYQTVSLNLTTPNSNQEKLSDEEPIVNTENRTLSPSNEDNPSPRKREPKVNDRRSQPSLGQLLFGKEDKETTEEEEVEQAKVAEEKGEEVTEFNNNLSDAYKPNNIVFLLDASTSMREQSKMDLLKKAMITLLEPLRPIDYLSIVTYSGEAEVVLKPTSAINKSEIKETINSIEADGSTQAVKGIKKAIKVAKSNFIEQGNNQILLVSDGAFDIGERNQSLRNQIKKESNAGLIISTVGIKNEKWTNKSLIEISELGNGSFQRIKKESDTNKLLEEVKQKAFIE